MPNKADIIIHPIRLRIMAELGLRQRTPRQLATALADVPQATLYRHINTLYENGVIEVVSETPVNGALERTYGIAKNHEKLTADDLTQATPADHLRYFNVYMASLTHAFTHYIDGKTSEDIVRGGLAYNQIVAYLSDEELAVLHQQLAQLLQPLLAHQPAADRKRFTIGALIIPEDTTP